MWGEIEGGGTEREGEDSRERGRSRWSCKGREGGKKKDIDGERLREKGCDKGEMERE